MNVESSRVARWGVLALSVAALAAVALAAGLYFFQFRPDQQTDDAAAQAAVLAATEGATALLSYSFATADDDLAAAKSHLTGEFLTYYSDFTEKIMAVAVKQREVQASVEVQRAAVATLEPDTAVVLLFVDQTTASRDRPDPRHTANSVRVTLTKSDGSWLISKFEPE